MSVLLNGKIMFITKVTVAAAYFRTNPKNKLYLMEIYVALVFNPSTSKDKIFPLH